MNSFDRDVEPSGFKGEIPNLKPEDDNIVPIYVRGWCKTNCEQYGECGWYKKNCPYYNTPQWIHHKG